MIHPLVPCTADILKQPVEKFDFQNPPTDPIELAHDLAQTMIANEGLGLSANQIGLPYRAFAMKAEQIVVCFNPIVVDASSEQLYLEEGCLSYPMLFVKVKRPKTIKVRYTEPNGNVVTKVYDGMTARIFQHELSHLNGLTFIREASKIHVEQAKNKLKRLQRKYK